MSQPPHGSSKDEPQHQKAEEDASKPAARPAAKPAQADAEPDIHNIEAEPIDPNNPAAPRVPKGSSDTPPARVE